MARSTLRFEKARLRKVLQLVCCTCSPLLAVLLGICLILPLQALIKSSKPQFPVEQQEDITLVSSIFHSPKIFKLNYEQMERRLKIFVYPDEDPNTYFRTPTTATASLSGKYTSEGYFFKNIRESKFLTNDPQRADLFFIPISCTNLSRKGLSYQEMTRAVEAYVGTLIIKYPYWNRTLGADHFFVTCHEIGLRATVGIPNLVKNSIRVVCGPRDNHGFIPHKDFHLPHIIQPFVHPAPKFDPNSRTTFVFWVGNGNAKLRGELLTYWQNDADFIHNPNVERLNTAKFCICLASWFRVHGSLITLALHHGCVPVILMDHNELPFHDVLDWTKFSIMIKASDVQQVKPILNGVSDAKFRFLHYNAVQVQRHLRWNSPPLKYDAFDMVMYQLWLRRHVSKYWE